jgi:hypothetical protein
VSNDRVMRNYFLVLRSKADFDLYFWSFRNDGEKFTDKLNM